MGRVLSMWLPQLPLDRWRRRRDARLDGPFAIIRDERNAWRVTHATPAALAAGAAPGLSLPDARAICPDLLVEPADRPREDEVLRALARWADRLSPRVAVEAPDGLTLDITGCAHLFGGEEAMAREALDRVTDLAITARIGVADTKRAARALARYGDGPIARAAPGEHRQALADLPVAALGLTPDTVSDLARAGLKTVGQLYPIKTSELARRCGLALPQALNAALGRSADPICPTAHAPTYAARMSLPEPVGLTADIERILARLAASVCARLEADGKGARRFVLVVRCVETGDHEVSVGFARPCCEVGPLTKQFAHAIDTLTIGFGADWFRLSAADVEPIRLRQASFEDEGKGEAPLAQLLTTLGNRIGFDRVRQFAAVDAHTPEREHTLVEAVHRRDDAAWVPAPRARPLRLYTPPHPVTVLRAGRPPQRFSWRGGAYDTLSAHGPERVTPQWWRDADRRTRDYWRVQTRGGPRLWLMTHPGADQPRWYVAGRWP